MRLDIPAGTAVRFEPGDEREVSLVAIGGARRAIGFSALVDGDLDDVEGALARARARRVLGGGPRSSRTRRWRGPMRISRDRYARLYGPTAGDKFRLADTDLVCEVERDLRRARRRGGLRRRQDDPRRHGPEPALQRRGRPRPRHHQRRGDRPDARDRQGRYRRQGRADRRAGQGRQPGHPGRRRPAPGDRPRHRGDRRRAPDRHARRHRQPHPHDLPAAGLRGALERHHHHHRRRHRPGRWHRRHDLHGRPLEHQPDAPGRRQPAAERRACSARATPAARPR